MNKQEAFKHTHVHDCTLKIWKLTFNKPWKKWEVTPPPPWQIPGYAPERRQKFSRIFPKVIKGIYHRDHILQHSTFYDIANIFLFQHSSTVDSIWAPNETVVVDSGVSICMQNTFYLGIAVGKEDCLYLNVYLPEVSFFERIYLNNVYLTQK